MKPNFALDLTHDSVSLLHRTPNGWLFVGKVMLDADDLAGEIAFWRGTAQSLAPHGMTSKLVIPNSEVLYRRLHAPGPDDKSRDAQIRAQIDGLTPYAIDELVFDWVAAADGKSVDVAVVARETLAEAEAFAVEHKLNPVSFVAKPDAADFVAEPFFGATRCAPKILGAGTVPERESVTIAVTGKAAVPAKTPATAAVPSRVGDTKGAAPSAPAASVVGTAAVAPAAAKVGALSSIASKIAQTVRPTPPTPAPTPTPTPAPAPKRDAPPATPAAIPAASTPPVAVKTDKPVITGPVAGPTESVRAAPSVAPSTNAPRPSAADAPIVAFRSGRSGKVDPVLVPQAPADQPASRLQLPPQMAESSGGFAERAAALLKGKKAAPASELQTPEPEASQKTPDIAPVKKPVAVEKSAPKGVPPSAPNPALRSVPALEPVGKPATGAAVAASAGAKGSAGGTLPAEKPELQPDARKAEAEAMTVFGARRNAQDDTGFMKRGVLLTIGLLLILAAVALASVFLTNDRDADVATQTSVAPAPVTSPEPLALTQDDAPLVDELLPEDTTAAAAVPAEEPAAVADADVPADAVEPEFEFGAAETTPIITDSDAAVMEALGIAPETGAEVAPDADVAAEVAAPTELATGDVQLGPQGANAPAIDQGGFSLSTTTAPALADLIAGLPALSPPGELPSLPPPSLAPPAPFGTEFDLGPDGLVVPTPDGALTPQGVRVHAGSPSVTPPARPEVPASFTPVAPSAPAEAPETTAPVQQGAVPELDDALRPGADPALAGFRPQTRPVVDGGANGDAVETATAETVQDETVAAAAQAQPVASPGGLALTALAGVRPAARPSDLVAGAGSLGAGAASPASDDPAPEEIVSDNPLAVAASRRPNNRPSDFSSRVQAAIAATQRAPAPAAAAAPPVQQASAAAAATPRPSIPSSASVAEQATETRAINLRRVNLLGVFGTANNRAALVRLSNGNVVRVSVGDRLDGGQVSAISETQLRYVKSGRNQVLTIGSSS